MKAEGEWPWRKERRRASCPRVLMAVVRQKQKWKQKGWSVPVVRVSAAHEKHSESPVALFMRASAVVVPLLGFLHTASGFIIPGFRPLATAAGSLRSRILARTVTHRAQMSVVSPYADKPYPVGKPGTPWGAEERAAWLARQVNQRSYSDEVLQKIDVLRSRGLFEVEQYGSLSVDRDRYPLFVFKTPNWDASKPACLVTGGVHGYETSGVQGALLFLETEAEKYADRVNLVVAPCVSPWGYEHIQVGLCMHCQNVSV